MNPELKQKWIEALRSGKYKQGKKRLRHAGRYCCLGVLADIQGADWRTYHVRDDGDEILSEKWAAGLSLKDQERLADRNDSGASFSEISDLIEKNL